MATQIHPTAVVSDGAQLGEDVVIGPYCIIEDKVEIGDRSHFEPHATVKSFTRMGADCVVNSYAYIGGEPQDLKYHGEESWLVMGDGNRIREYVTIHRGTEGGGGETRLGSGCLIMGYVHIAHDCRLGDGVIISNATSLAGHIGVGNHAVIAGMTGVHQFVKIGDHAFVGAMSGLAQDVPPFAMANGVRAKLYGLNVVGLRRHGFSAETIAALKKAYALLVAKSGSGSRSDALDEVDATLGDIPEVAVFADFIRHSERGICSHARQGNGNGNGEGDGE